MPDDFSVITLATNQLSYVEFALNCAQSVLLFNDIKIYIVSNLKFEIPESFKNNVFILKAKDEHCVLGIGGKLYINEYLQTEHTLFIDSDCLCYGSLGSIFKACEGKNVSVAGTIVDAAEWVGTKEAITIEKEFGLKKLPRFNGGMYYLKKSAKTQQIFDSARSIMPSYDKFGFSRIRNKWINEEPLIGISMMLYDETPIPDDGRFMTDFSTDYRPKILNVLKGERLLRNPAYPVTKVRGWYPQTYSPIILHFGGSNLKSYPYRSQSSLLRFFKMGVPVSLASLIVYLIIDIPYKTYHAIRLLINRPS